MPDLPFELEREIFELVFRLDPQNAVLKLTLCMVARRVQTWIDPIFYGLVTIETDRHAQLFLTLVDSNLKPPGFFSAVKILSLTFYVSAANACRILAACAGIEMLACWVDFITAPEFPEFITLVKRLPLCRLSLEFAHLSRILVPTAAGHGSSAGWLSNLTHLHIVVWPRDNSNVTVTERMSTLQFLPHLTHLALDFGESRWDLGAQYTALVCSVCPSLRVFVVQMDPPFDLDPEKEDRRLVMQDRRVDLLAAWAASYFGLPDMWSLAETAIENRAVAGGIMGSNKAGT
ncbi:hypothetical protein C8R46DRAFT_654185 [Mycena filopes]|nr:hypothetical protein C8R46DRAFT_654185 [Mycena filopes]